MQMYILISFLAYLIVLIAMGVYFYRRSSHVDDYFLGGRKLGRWVAAISAQASDMSGWLLMGLPGAIYLKGAPAVWIAIGLFAGTYANWKLVAPRLRIYTEKVGAITLPIFFEKRFRDSSGVLRIITALITLFFFSIYVSSGFVASGKLFQEVLGIDYVWAVALGGGIIVLYTFLGGFLAVSWTDLLQGMIMVCGIVITVAVSYFASGGVEGVLSAMSSSHVSRSLIPAESMPLIAIVSLLAWGLGYFGQPHILVRFMAIDRVEHISSSRKIALRWLIFSLGGSVAIGFIAIAVFPGLSGGREEKVFLYLVQKLFHPLVAGILLSALLSAIMSTIDSQLLVCSSNITEDIYLKLGGAHSSERSQVLMGRISVLAISLVAGYLALDPSNTVLGVVAYAWGGFGAAFGPVVLFAIFSERVTGLSALAGMVVGTLVLVLWKQFGYGEVLYEIVPGFVANVLVIACLNMIIPQKDEDIRNLHKEISNIHCGLSR